TRQVCLPLRLHPPVIRTYPKLSAEIDFFTAAPPHARPSRRARHPRSSNSSDKIRCDRITFCRALWFPFKHPCSSSQSLHRGRGGQRSPLAAPGDGRTRLNNSSASAPLRSVTEGIRGLPAR